MSCRVHYGQQGVASNDIKGLIFLFSFRFFCVAAPGFAGWEHTGSKILAVEGWRNQWWTPHWLTQTALQRSLPSYAFRGTSIHQSFDSSLILLASKKDFRAFTMHNYIVIVKWLQIACMLCSECYSLHCWWPCLYILQCKGEEFQYNNRACSWS